MVKYLCERISLNSASQKFKPPTETQKGLLSYLKDVLGKIG